MGLGVGDGRVVGVGVHVGSGVAVGVGVSVGVTVAVGVGVAVGKGVAVGVGVAVSVGMAATVASTSACTVARISGVEVGVGVGRACWTAASTVAGMSGVGVGGALEPQAATANPVKMAANVAARLTRALLRVIWHTASWYATILSLARNPLTYKHRSASLCI